MLKKLLILLPLLGILGVAFWANERIQANPDSVLPIPYVFPTLAEKIAVDSPLLIVGDRMAERFGLFKETLSLELSTGLSKPLKTGVLANPRAGLHRTLRSLESLDAWPKVMIYTGGSEEMAEETFRTSEISKIRRNFERYGDDRWRTLMMLWPESARLIYTPLVRQVLPDEVSLEDVNREVSEGEYQARLELSYRLYEMELVRLVELARAKNVTLLFMTVPINLDVPPRLTCSNSQSEEISREMEAIRALIREQNYKAAYPRAQELAASTLANAEVFFLHGQISYRMGRLEEAKKSLHAAAAFDCRAWRSNQVTNNIIRKVADEQRVTLFDFADMVDADWRQNATFFNEIYPQDLYYERAAKALGAVLRRMLKL